MLRHLAILIAAVLFLASCQDKKQAAIQLNNDLTTINDSLFYKGRAWGEEFRVAFNTRDFSQLQPIRMEMQSYIEESIKFVKELEDVKGSNELRKAQLDYLQFERDVISTQMAKFEQFNDSTSHEEISQAFTDLLKMSQLEQAKLTGLARVQKEFAEENNVVLKPSAISVIE